MLRTRNCRPLVAVGIAVAVEIGGFRACQEKEPRPPRLSCQDENCSAPPPVTGRGPARPPPEDAASDVPADALADLTGTVQIFSGEDFQLRNSVAFLGTAEVRAEGPAGEEIVTSYDGQNPFLLSGVRFDEAVWVRVVPDAPAEEAMPTLTAFDTTLPEPVVVALVRGSSLDLIYSSLITPLARTPGTGHVVLQFVEDSAAAPPLAGVQVTMAGAEARVYDTGGSFSEIESATGPLGLALFANVTAVQAPGTDHTVRMETPVPGTMRLRIAADTATFAQIRLSR